MLRLLVLLLVLANAGYYAWGRGLLAPYGLGPIAQAEPQRMAQQIRPEAVRIFTPLEARQIEAPASAPGLVAASTLASTPSASTGAVECLQVGIFNEEQTVVLRERLGQTLPAGSWVLESALEPARWMVYMGKYANADAVTKKKGELRGRGVSFEALNNPALEPGLSLGNFSDQLDAQAELERIAKLGVKTARVIQAQPELRGQKLKLAAVTPALRAQLEALKPQLAGKTLQACR